MAAPSPESIKDSVEKSASFVNWLAEMLRGKNPVKKLLLIDVLLFTIFNPLTFPALLKSIAGKDTPAWYGWLFWPAIALVFITAVIAAIRIKQRESESFAGQWDERSAIRGLLPFEFTDAGLFSRLQREDDFRACFPVLTNSQFRFGILCGESGSGKTSFLQASLWPRLMEQGRRCLYVKFTDLDPLDSIRAAFSDQFKLPKEAVDGAADLLALLDVVLQVDSQPVILLFDQFEQFFVHRKQAKQREPFVQALAAWYRKQPPLPVRVLVCIRKDFYGDLIELHTAIGYSLGPQENIPLKKFEPEQAARIFQVIAEIEHVSIDETFVNEFTQQELASRDDGLISPVDIQILAWMIVGQKSREEWAFNRESFQRLGGIEGLLERFLNCALEVRETESRRQSAIKVLLALTDLDRNARAGVLTLTALKEKLAGTISDAEAEEALEWLARADVRLVNTIDDGYELAHERLIPALRRIADKELTIPDKANQLLDRRVNEWLGNNRASRYLLGWREWRLIEQQRPYLVWGPQKAHKESLLSQTRQRWRIRAASITSLLVLASSLSIGYSIWLNSEAGQIYQIKRDLLRLSKGTGDPNTLSQVVKSLAITDMFQQAFQLADEIDDPESKAGALSALAKVMANTDVKGAKELFGQAINIADEIDDPTSKSLALSVIAEAMAKINANQSEKLLGQAKGIAEGIIYPDNKAWVLSRIAGTMAKVAVAKQSAELFGQAVEIIKGIGNSYLTRNAWNIIAEAAAKIDVKQSAELFGQAVEVAKRMDYPDFKSITLSVIAGTMARVAVAKQSPELLERAKGIAEEVDIPYKAVALSKIAEAIEKIDDDQSQKLLRRAKEIAEGVKNSGPKAYSLSAIAEAMAKIAAAKQSTELLEQALETINGTNHSYQANALGAIAETAIKLKNLRLARDTALMNRDDQDKLIALALVLKTWAELRNPALADKDEESQDQ